jgi:16S rRNA (guanine527-N7)-methyltransferase
LDELQGIVGSVSRETFERLEIFEESFRRTASGLNLVARSTLDAFWRRHVLDSAQIIPLSKNAQRFADIGSGGGFPGAVLAILLWERGARVDLIESSQKKARFLENALREAGIEPRVHPARVEAIADKIDMPDIVTARAVAALPALLRLAEPWLSKGAVALFHKGRDYAREVRESRDEWEFDLLENQSAIESDSRILRISNLRRVR